MDEDEIMHDDHGDHDMEDQEHGAAAAADLKAAAQTVGGMEVLPWVEKYRPKTLGDLVAHKDIITTIRKLVDSNRLPHMLLHGPPGTGKTSTILACAKEMYGNRYKSMVLELNASDARGIDVVRNEIKTFVAQQTISFKREAGQVKMVILDEADSMTNQAQFAMRRIIEQYSAHARFGLICNYVQKIIPALQSRCTKFRFGPLADDDVRGRIDYIAAEEKLTIPEDGLQALIKIGGGDMRRVLNIMQAASMAFDRIDENAVYLTTGTPLQTDIDSMFDTLMTKTFSDAFTDIDAVCARCGYALTDVIQGVFEKLSRTQMPNTARLPLFSSLSEIEAALAKGATEKTQLGALVGHFHLARNAIEKTKA
ncbi:unnamed protein product [Vitrella brassicaformis CCMP3155]|uniref:AAA+ ATPase domain-containing protein n=2 Tax=Vitrella brassicaformis TaxID=1169539 RepID=A0A0G4FVM3_VITBC|nr:unnamed protein product [Vitrella brassicaformis CCMP3155]|mmetsp:Transcript_27335/g.68183  ORF Transcript_27335/g.68183 Transcript_27335/m.68183 type:complete len:367 (+) Transcript_27335:191-1291(+)|eukprot:CEM19264.1 unnamed protein product [Vitrella brassicaformis CCMP3155]